MITFVKLHQVDKDLLTYVNVSDILFVEQDGGGSLIHLRPTVGNGRVLCVTESPDDIMDFITSE